MAVQISKKRKFVADGIFKAELNEFLTRELAEDGYSGVEVRVTPTRTEIIILATRTQNVLGEKGRRIRELTAVVQKRFGFPEGSVELYAEKVATRGLCAIAQAESLRYKLLGGLAVRRACYGVLRFIMESGAKGCEVVVSGKLRGQRAKSMKFVDGLMIHSGDPVNYYVDTAVRHVLLRQESVCVAALMMGSGYCKPFPFCDDTMTSQKRTRSCSEACYGVLRFIMESGAKGCEVVVSGKLRGQRAKSMKFVDGLMIHSGDPVNYYVDTAVRHVLLRQGTGVGD
ncbi:PREDICTED: 40S ribosomal protein S3-like, partial [Gekko japonicus]|uniref:DNA-(apurinic or apyrimidinic site) lyase n=1 Tax=Gekko japonicus TaxID=146911 RepID=A0ABM1KJ51_GEKJA